MADETLIDANKARETVQSLVGEVGRLRADHEAGRTTIADLNTRIQSVVTDLALAQRSLNEAQGRERLEAQGRQLASGDERDMCRSLVPEAASASVGAPVLLYGREVTHQFAGRTARAYVPGLLDSAPKSELHAEIRRCVDTLAVGRILAPHVRMDRTEARLLHLLSRTPAPVRSAVERALSDATVMRSAIGPDKRRAFGDASTLGAELIPDRPSVDLAMYFARPNVLLDRFTRQPLPGPTVLPRMTVGGRPYIRNGSTSDNPANMQASNATFASKTIQIPTLGTVMWLDDSAVEDAIIAIVPLYLAHVGRTIQDGYEDAALHGDTAASHQDAIESWDNRSRWGSSGLGSSTDHRRLWIGGRAQAFDTSSTYDFSSSSAQDNPFLHALAQTKLKMGERAGVSTIAVTSPETVIRNLIVNKALLTFDQAGLAATLLSGVAPTTVLGTEFIMSRFLSPTFASTGLYTGSGTTDTIVCMDTASWVIYEHSAHPDQVELHRDPLAGAHAAIATARKTLDSPFPLATEKISAVMINVT